MATLALLASAVADVPVRAAGAKVEWVRAGSLSKADRDAIVALARRSGLGQPARVRVDLLLPSTLDVVVAESGVRVRGARRQWDTLSLLRRRPGSACDNPNGLCEDRWYVSDAVTTHTAWRVQDGRWFHDVELGHGLNLADVEPLVLAIHRGDVADARVMTPPDPRMPPGVVRTMPRIDADAIRSIDRQRDGFEVRVGAGAGYDIFTIRWSGSRFEITAWAEVVV